MRFTLHKSKSSKDQGFTLIEILLCVVLLGLLVSAIVVNFVGMERGSKLREGATQVEALFRFARAHAANTGRIVQLQVDETGDGLIEPDKRSLVLVCENDPVRNPGYFEPIPQCESYLRQINEQVEIMNVKVLGAEPEVASSEDEEEFDAWADESAPIKSPVISFFPDGSSDSAEVLLLSRQNEDPAKLLLRLSGILGTVRRDAVVETNAITAAAPDLTLGANDSSLR